MQLLRKHRAEMDDSIGVAGEGKRGSRGAERERDSERERKESGKLQERNRREMMSGERAGEEKITERWVMPSFD